MRHFHLFLYIFVSYLSANSQTLTGNVMTLTADNKYEPLPSATLFWLNTEIGTEADSLGHFSLDFAASSDKLVVSFVGFVDDTLTVKNNLRFLNIIKKKSISSDSVLIKANQSGATISTLNPHLTETLNQRELYKAACCNLGESFQTNASVDVSFQDAVSGAKQIRLLGLSGIYSQILTENTPSIRGLATTYGLGYVPGPWMEKIDISKGAASVLNGYEGLTGQINVEYKKPERSPKLYVNFYGNQMTRMETSINYAMPVGKSKKVHTMLMLHGNIVPMAMDRNKDGFADEHLQKQFIIHNRWTYFDEKGREMQLSVKHLEEKRLGGQIMKMDMPAHHIFQIGMNTSRTEIMNKMAWVSPKKTYKSLGLSITGILHNQTGNLTRFQYTGKEENLSIKLVHENIIGNTNHIIRVGTSYVYDNFSEKMQLTDTNLLPAYGLKAFIAGLFGEYTYTYLERFSFVGGLRADYHSVYGLLLTPRLHLRYLPTEKTTIRLSAGRGMRTPRMFADNMGAWITGRPLFSLTSPYDKMEKGWNYGISVQQYLKIGMRDMRIVADFFRTDFTSQYILDREKYNYFTFYYTNHAFSNAFQIEASYEIARNLELKAAYKWNQVRALYESGWKDVPFVPKQRALLTASYKTDNEKWTFDLTSQWIGKSRIPNLEGNSAASVWTQTSPSFMQFFGQITHSFKHFDVYLGGENLSNYTQQSPIISANNPFSSNFDAAMIWGPIYGAMGYVGLRWTVK